MARKPAAPAKKQGNLKKILTYSVALIVCAVGGYFGVTYVMQLQEKANEKRRAAERNADGGEMGHIANLYDVLDRTEPGGRGLGSTPRASGPRAQPGTRAIDVPPAQTPADPAAANKALPVIPPVYALETVTTNIPESRVNGMISGTNFLADTVRIDSAGTAQVLRFIQGTPASPDRELLIYLHPKPAEKTSGHTWTIKADQRGSDVPQVVKRAKINPKYAATSKSFPYGYAMTLELGPTTNTTAVGKIYIALPDAEKSVVAGVFTASTTPTVDAAISTITTPAATAPSSPQNAAFQQRYGIKR